jgi:beta-glucosidase
MEAHDWYVESGKYFIQIGKSSHEIICEESVEIISEYFKGANEYNTSSTIGEIIRHPLGKKFWDENIGKFVAGLAASGMMKQEQMDAMGIQPNVEVSKQTIDKMFGNSVTQGAGFNGMEVLMSLPVTMLCGFIKGLSMQDLQTMFDQMNKN